MSTFSSYDGTRLSYDTTGTGPLLVCHPGGPGRAAAYLEDLGGLTATRSLVLLDPRGVGRSELPADPATLRFDRLAADLEALRVELGQEQLDLLGHSAGALVAMVYAARHPERLSRLVLVTPSGRLAGGGSDVDQIRSARSGEDWYDGAARAAAELAGAPPAARRAFETAQRPFFYGRWDERTAAHAAGADRQMSARAEAGFAGGAGPAGDDALDRDGIVAGLRAVSAPVLVVAGERDGVTGVEAARRAAAAFPDARPAVLPRAGHFPWVDEPDAFREAVSGFLR